MAEQHQARAALVFSAPVVKELLSDQVRLPPNYVGVRRIRPSNLHVQNEFRGVARKQEPPLTEVVYKITALNGVERRMNSQEKKQLKLKLRKERELARKQQKKSTMTLAAENDKLSPPSSQQQEESSTLTTSTSCTRYHQLHVNEATLEEELADLRGDRDGVPPVMLSPSIAGQAFRCGILPTDNHNPVSTHEMQAVLDVDLANEWAVALKVNMKSAEDVRSKDKSIRRMPYQVIPEVWTRLRPHSLSTASKPDCSKPLSLSDGTNRDREDGSVVAFDPDDKRQELEATIPVLAALPFESSSNVCSMMIIRQGRGQVDSDENIIVSMLHHQTNLHISCGAKFGCDFLLYDGRRDERHAFAGLRIVERRSPQQEELTLPSPYDLTGYVRCLNTAGKLALLATVQHDDELDVARVAIVDLALEKVIMQHRGKRKRRDVGKNLAKRH